MVEQTLRPGTEVVLHGGSTGVLYAQEHPSFGRRRSQLPRWFFLPDGAGAPGLVVTSQRRSVTTSDIAEVVGFRGGSWPLSTYRLDAPHRQKVYVAHMAGLQPPLPP